MADEGKSRLMHAILAGAACLIFLVWMLIFFETDIDKKIQVGLLSLPYVVAAGAVAKYRETPLGILAGGALALAIPLLLAIGLSMSPHQVMQGKLLLTTLLFVFVVAIFFWIKERQSIRHGQVITTMILVIGYYCLLIIGALTKL